jgi:hypothetical protein
MGHFLLFLKELMRKGMVEEIRLTELRGMKTLRSAGVVRGMED